MWAQIISAILSALGGAGDVASAAGSLSPALSGLSSIGSAMSPYSKALSSLGGIASNVGGLMAGGGGVTGSGAIGQRPATIAPGASGTPTGLTADSAKTGLAALKSQGQASGLSGLSDDSYIEQLAQQFGVDPDQVRKMLGGAQMSPGQGVYNG